MEVNDQLQTPTDLPPEKKALVSTGGAVRIVEAVGTLTVFWN
jgi:hypothetical protein